MKRLIALCLTALCAADTLLVPLQCEFFALEGLSQLLQTVEQVQQRFNPNLGIVGIALTMFDRRNRLTDQVADDVEGAEGVGPLGGVDPTLIEPVEQRPERARRARQHAEGLVEIEMHASAILRDPHRCIERASRKWLTSSPTER